MKKELRQVSPIDLEHQSISDLFAVVSQLHHVEVIEVIGNRCARVVRPVSWKILISPEMLMKKVALLKYIELHQRSHRVDEQLEHRLSHVGSLAFTNL